MLAWELYRTADTQHLDRAARSLTERPWLLASWTEGGSLGFLTVHEHLESDLQLM